MALFPCAVGSHRYAGPQRSAYLGVANGGISARSKLRLCRTHFDSLRSYVDSALRLVAIGDTGHDDVVETGVRCDHHPDQLAEYRMFATLYPLGEEAYIYYGVGCGDCSDSFRRVGQIELS